MERYIAIDNVCAWPNLTKMPDGAIIATIFNQPCHGLWGEPMRIVELQPGDLGYPATVPGEGGTLVTAWYSAGVAAHQRYHMGAAVSSLQAEQ